MYSFVHSFINSFFFYSYNYLFILYKNNLLINLFIFIDGLNIFTTEGLKTLWNNQLK